METDSDGQAAGKRIVASHALERVKPGMTIGLGSGSTAAEFVRQLGSRVADGLKIRGVATSKATEVLARRCQIPLIALGAAQIDLTVDGADEVDTVGDLIKGGGGALLREKIVAASSRQVCIVAERRKRVSNLGAFPLPVEVASFGWRSTKARVFARVRELGYSPTGSLRTLEGSKVAMVPFLSDGGNYILDLRLSSVQDKRRLADCLDAEPGVVCHGLFLGMADEVLCGTADHVDCQTYRRATGYRS